MAGNSSHGEGNCLPQNLQKVLQVISHKGILSDDDLEQIFKKILGNQERGKMNFSRHINEINTYLKEIDLTVRSVICELTGLKYWSLVSTVLNDSDGEGEDEDDEDEGKYIRSRGEYGAANNDEENESGSLIFRFTKSQMEFFKLICEEIIMSPTNCIPSINCINLVGHMEGKFTRSEAEKFLRQTVKDLWLSLKDGQVFMGAKSIAELMPYFKTNYEGGLKYCPLCKQAVFYGHECTNEQCQIKCHFHCLVKFLKFSREIKCSNCGEQLNIDENLLSSYTTPSDDLD